VKGLQRFGALAGLAIVLSSGFSAPVRALAGDENDPLVKLIERQLDSVVRGTSAQVGVPLGDG